MAIGVARGGARLGGGERMHPHDFGARTTLRAVSGLALVAQSCREDQDSDVNRAEVALDL